LLKKITRISNGVKKRRNKKIKKAALKEKKTLLVLPEESKKWIFGLVFFILAIIVSLSFFELSGIAGKAIMNGLSRLIGNGVFAIPLILILGGLVFFFTRYQNFFGPLILASLLLILGICGIIECLKPNLKEGGYLGLISLPFLKLFGFLVSQIILGGIIICGIFIFWHLLKQPAAEKKPSLPAEAPAKVGLIRRIFAPRFKVKEVEPKIKEKATQPPAGWVPSPELKVKEGPQKPFISEVEYKLPPFELLDSDKGAPSAGDVRINSAIIKRTLENFSIPVEMSEINIGPTVTQYTLKPADGIKLSKITALSNDLSLALASHPIRIEAPIPGKPLVGIEVPNKVRAAVRLRDLIQNPQFQQASSNLTFALGRDVSGNPLHADLSRMPHLLVAGSTGTGKTIFLNSLILSLLYRNSPEILRFILIDPKRVEFPVYEGLPHLLCPVIFDAQKTINSLKCLVSEMERRFEILSEEKCRDITSFNEIAFREGTQSLPYIILIIDELADLMAARGREVEAGIVRLAQMARAVGIHLVVATQRPSVEVITGLIKANITSRITFQVASQVDSRTVLDMAGAEKLLGLGDMLFVSAEIVKPRRIQGPYVSEKEVRRVVNYIKIQNSKFRVPAERVPKLEEGILDYTLPPPNKLAEDLEKTLEAPSGTGFEGFYTGEDPLYEEAKRVVIEARKASASLLQRRLRIGYARAARLIDTLEERGVVGPGEGAKPREILIKTEEEEDDEGWQKI